MNATTRQTTTSLLASANPATVGQAVTFTAVVRDPSGTGTPTGTVTFFVGNTVVARVTLDASGQARIRGSFSVAGRFTIRAVYSGNATFDASEQSLTEQVNAPTHKATTSLLASANPARAGQAVSFTTVHLGTGTPTGTVTFFVGNTVVARVRLDANGQARIRCFFSVSGRFTIRVVYSGDATFDDSEQSLTEQVNL